MNLDFQRVAIVNRGEAAMRFIHAAREFNQEHGTELRTIALFTEPDRHAMFVREADEAVCLGPVQVLDPNTRQLKSSYVDYGVLERALAGARAEAVWVGWGFVAEHAAFADLCHEMGIVFIGPTGDVMRRVGDKIASKLLAEKSNIPVAPWSGSAVETLADAERHAQHSGYPSLLKPLPEEAVTEFTVYFRPTNSRRPLRGRAAGHSRCSGTQPSLWSSWFKERATSKSRSSQTTSERHGLLACATARSSAGIKRSSRKRPRRRFPRSRIMRCVMQRCA